MGGVLQSVVDGFFPPQCVGCRTFGVWWCAVCEGHRSASPPQESTIEGVLILSAHSYRCVPVAHAIQALKFFRVAAVSTLAALWLGSVVDAARRTGGTARRTILVPVPLHPRRLRWRGFNQALAVCQAITRCNTEVHIEEVLCRTKYAQPQVGSDVARRTVHTGNAFAIAPSHRVDAQTHFIIVDDVITTGSTLRACIQTIRAAGAARISCITIAGA